jgi:hypothetical protein
MLASRASGNRSPMVSSRRSFINHPVSGQKAVNTIDGAEYQTGLVRSKSTRKNKELRRVKMQSVGSVTFAKINSCTYRVDTRNKRAAGWLMEVAWPGESRQRWLPASAIMQASRCH